MSTTTLVPVKLKLIDLLVGRPGLAGTQIGYRWPGDATEQEAIWLGDSRGAGTYPVMRAGRKPRDELYTFDVFLQVLTPDALDETSELRALELLAELEDVVADDPGLGLGGTHPTLVARVASWASTNGLLESGWGTVIKADIEVKSRLT